jgi:hypothetical protein
MDNLTWSLKQLQPESFNSTLLRGPHRLSSVSIQSTRDTIDMSELNVFATTFNLATRAAALTDGELHRWLAPMWNRKDGVKADVVVISIQEMSPLHVSSELQVPDI